MENASLHPRKFPRRVVAAEKPPRILNIFRFRGHTHSVLAVLVNVVRFSLLHLCRPEDLHPQILAKRQKRGVLAAYPAAAEVHHVVGGFGEQFASSTMALRIFTGISVVLPGGQVEVARPTTHMVGCLEDEKLRQPTMWAVGRVLEPLLQGVGRGGSALPTTDNDHVGPFGFGTKIFVLHHEDEIIFTSDNAKE